MPTSLSVPFSCSSSHFTPSTKPPLTLRPPPFGLVPTPRQVYSAALLSPDAAAVNKIVRSLSLTVSPRELDHADHVVSLRAIMRAWLPLAPAVLNAIAAALPSARIAQKRRLAVLCPALMEATAAEAAARASALVAADSGSGSGGCGGGDGNVGGDGNDGGGGGVSVRDDVVGSGDGGGRIGTDVSAASMLPVLRRSFERCDGGDEAPVILYVAKLVSSSGVSGAHAEDEFIGFARIFSGTLRPGREDGGRLLYVVQPEVEKRSDDPDEGADESGTRLHTVHTIAETSLRLYLMMGRSLVSVDSVFAGDVCGIGGLARLGRKSATISTAGACPPLRAMALEGSPIVTVAVEAASVAQTHALDLALHTLDVTDPA
eukprot:2774433-Pleurochrysis_carterae.AAC.1